VREEQQKQQYWHLTARTASDCCIVDRNGMFAASLLDPTRQETVAYTGVHRLPGLAARGGVWAGEAALAVTIEDIPLVAEACLHYGVCCAVRRAFFSASCVFCRVHAEFA
jgi:hypothetical protein